MSSTPPRKNGFSRPFSGMQVGTWVILPTLMAQFLFFCSPLLPWPVSIPVTIVFFGFAFASAYFGFMACVTDPIDRRLACHWHQQRQQQQQESSRDPAFRHSAGVATLPEEERNEPTKYCWVCETTVAEHSMHCKFCNKCVSHFDHHCQWLNTCVGDANYRYFYSTLWAITGVLTTHIAVMLGIVVDIFLKGTTEQRGEDWFDAGLSELVAAVNIFFVVFDGIALSLIVQLLFFHISLRKEGLSTYQFILRDNQRKRDKRKIVAARRAKRIVELATARRNRNYGKVCRFQTGAHCRSIGCTACDPLQDVDIPSSASNVSPVQPEPYDEEEDDNDEDVNDEENDRDDSGDQEAPVPN